MTRSLNLPRVPFFSVKSQALLAWSDWQETLQKCWRGETLVSACPPAWCRCQQRVKHLEKVWGGAGKHFLKTRAFRLMRSEGCQCCCQNPPYFGVGTLWLESWWESLLQGGVGVLSRHQMAADDQKSVLSLPLGLCGMFQGPEPGEQLFSLHLPSPAILCDPIESMCWASGGLLSPKSIQMGTFPLIFATSLGTFRKRQQNES